MDKDGLSLQLGEHIAKTGCTVREAAKCFSIGKSTVHKHITERLPRLDEKLYAAVRRILDYNLSVRHLRGGESTRRKCKKQDPEA